MYIIIISVASIYLLKSLLSSINEYDMDKDKSIIGMGMGMGIE